MSIWRVIPGWERYEVSNDGRVRRRTDGTELSGGLSSSGYWKVKLSRDDGKPEDLYVYVLMAAAFYGPRPEGAQIVHLNGDKTDDRLGNLRYQIIDTHLAQRAYQTLLRQRVRKV